MGFTHDDTEIRTSIYALLFPFHVVFTCSITFCTVTKWVVVSIFHDVAIQI